MRPLRIDLKGDNPMFSIRTLRPAGTISRSFSTSEADLDDDYNLVGSRDWFSENAWDCSPDFQPEDLSYDLDLNEEGDETDWQVLVLDRFGDRLVRG